VKPSRQHKQGAAVGATAAALLVALVVGGLLAKDQIRSGAAKPRVTPAAQILVLLNARRANAGLKPLRRDTVLASLARFHNRDMRSEGYFAHDAPQGQTFFERLAYLHRSLIGEVLAYGTVGFSTPKGLVSLWMASPGHKRVILTPGMKRIGISVICGRFLNQPGVCLSTADLSS
jgi:uncharacterized protein YkwD